MRKISAIFFLLHLISGNLFLKINAQVNLVPNPSFEIGQSGKSPQCNSHYSDDGCDPNDNDDDFQQDISDWRRAEKHVNCFCTIAGTLSCGSPDWEDISICNDGPSTYAQVYPSQRFVLVIGDESDEGYYEGVRVTLIQKLKGNTSYVLKFKFMNISASNNELIIYLTKWAEHWHSNSNNNIKLNVFTISTQTPFGCNPPSGSEVECNRWYTFYGIVTIASHLDDELENLIFLAEKGGWGIDDVELYEACPGELLIENRVYSGNFPNTIGNSTDNYEAWGTIRAGFDVGANSPNGDVIVETDGDVIYKAGEEISLEDGFEVEEGGEFYAYIAPCGWNCPPVAAFAGLDYNTWCEPGCKILGSTLVNGLSYLWSSNPPEAINYLSDPTAGSPLFCPPVNFAGTVSYTLRVISICEEVSYDDISIGTADYVNIDISTGTSNGALLQPGAIDPKWIITETPTVSNTTLPAYCSNSSNPWAVSSNAYWITPSIYGNNDPAIVALGYWTYTFTFNLTINPNATYKLNVTEFAGDNSATISLNGTDWISVTGFFSTLNGPFQKTDGFVNGLNTLTVKVENLSTISGFILYGNITNDCGSGKTNFNDQANNNKPIVDTTAIMNNYTKIDSSVIHDYKPKIKNTIIFPNPNKGEFHLMTGENSVKEYNIEIFDYRGAVLFNSICKVQSKFIINISYSPGIYFVKVITGDEVFVQKLIISE